MATFILTAKQNIDRGNGFHFSKGGTVELHINMAGINPNNLFSSSRCREQFLRQMSYAGIDLPKNDPVLNNRAYWDISMLK